MATRDLQKAWTMVQQQEVSTSAPVQVMLEMVIPYTATGKGLAHFFSFFSRAPPPPGGSGPILELVDFAKWRSPVPKLTLPEVGHVKIREKMCKTFARHCTHDKIWYSDSVDCLN